MIDTITLQTPIPIRTKGLRTPLSQILIQKKPTETFSLKATKTFFNSPLSNAQFWVQPVGGGSHGGATHLLIKIPLASVLVGHNHIHGGAIVVKHERRLLARLLHVLLHHLGLSQREASSVIRRTVVKEVEVTWHTETTSAAAARKLRERTEQHLCRFNRMSKRHDVLIKDVACMSSSTGKSMLVTCKDGDRFRQYSKHEQLKAKQSRCRPFSRQVDVQLARVQRLLPRHVRNELIFGHQSLAKYGARHIRDLTPRLLRRMIAAEWNKLRFGSKGALFDRLALRPQSLAFWSAYEQGSALPHPRGSAQFSRARTEILAANGPDIALPLHPKLSFQPANLGFQLRYERRWMPEGKIRRAVVSGRSVDDLMSALDQGLAYLRDGQLPEFRDDEQRRSWLKRWSRFLRPEWMVTGVDADTDEEAHNDQ